MELFEIRYLSLFRYPQPVWDSHNVLRAAPCSDERQILLSYRLSISPSSRVVSYTDYFGTRVDLFGVARPHRELEVLAEIRVAMQGDVPAAPPAALGPRSDQGFIESHHEYLVPSMHIEFADGVRREAREVVTGLPDDAGLVGGALAAHVSRTLQYAPGSTEIGIDVNELQRTRRGVCQDFAHYLIALCRSVGVPARYVSGYLFAARGDEATAPKRDEVFVQTHAWVEIAVPGAGWWPLDPTNRLTVGARHVKIGHGRDYDDVCPLRGLYHGPFQHELEAEVRMKRLGTGDSWASASAVS
ncbi:MAG TPA: transglutaminase family protein [Myxococcota bacterium]|nr:transglutaminase family protein [Myxococcota bacterium]